jgi:uncharacterized protein YsxB (DUF464 family)
MTKAVFKKQNGLWTSLEVSGHSGYSTAGSDIVCAGISTAVISSVNLLDKLIEGCFDVNQNEKDGYVSIYNLDYQNIEESKKTFVDLIFRNLYDTLKDIEDQYPKNLKVKIENNK